MLLVRHNQALQTHPMQYLAEATEGFFADNLPFMYQPPLTRGYLPALTTRQLLSSQQAAFYRQHLRGYKTQHDDDSRSPAYSNKCWWFNKCRQFVEENAKTEEEATSRYLANPSQFIFHLLYNQQLTKHMIRRP